MRIRGLSDSSYSIWEDRMANFLQKKYYEENFVEILENMASIKNVDTSVEQNKKNLTSFFQKIVFPIIKRISAHDSYFLGNDYSNFLLRTIKTLEYHTKINNKYILDNIFALFDHNLICFVKKTISWSKTIGVFFQTENCSKIMCDLLVENLKIASINWFFVIFESLYYTVIESFSLSDSFCDISNVLVRFICDCILLNQRMDLKKLQDTLKYCFLVLEYYNVFTFKIKDFLNIAEDFILSKTLDKQLMGSYIFYSIFNSDSIFFGCTELVLKYPRFFIQKVFEKDCHEDILKKTASIFRLFSKHHFITQNDLECLWVIANRYHPSSQHFFWEMIGSSIYSFDLGSIQDFISHISDSREKIIDVLYYSLLISMNESDISGFRKYIRFMIDYSFNNNILSSFIEIIYRFVDMALGIGFSLEIYKNLEFFFLQRNEFEILKPMIDLVVFKKIPSANIDSRVLETCINNFVAYRSNQDILERLSKLFLLEKNVISPSILSKIVTVDLNNLQWVFLSHIMNKGGRAMFSDDSLQFIKEFLLLNQNEFLITEGFIRFIASFIRIQSNYFELSNGSRGLIKDTDEDILNILFFIIEKPLPESICSQILDFLQRYWIDLHITVHKELIRKIIELMDTTKNPDFFVCFFDFIVTKSEEKSPLISIGYVPLRSYIFPCHEMILLRVSHKFRVLKIPVSKRLPNKDVISLLVSHLRNHEYSYTFSFFFKEKLINSYNNESFLIDYDGTPIVAEEDFNIPGFYQSDSLLLYDNHLTLRLINLFESRKQINEDSYLKLLFQMPIDQKIQNDFRDQDYVIQYFQEPLLEPILRYSLYYLYFLIINDTYDSSVFYKSIFRLLEEKLFNDEYQKSRPFLCLILDEIIYNHDVSMDYTSLWSIIKSLNLGLDSYFSLKYLNSLFIRDLLSFKENLVENIEFLEKLVPVIHVIIWKKFMKLISKTGLDNILFHISLDNIDIHKNFVDSYGFSVILTSEIPYEVRLAKSIELCHTNHCSKFLFRSIPKLFFYSLTSSCSNVKALLEEIIQLASTTKYSLLRNIIFSSFLDDFQKIYKLSSECTTLIVKELISEYLNPISLCKFDQFLYSPSKEKRQGERSIGIQNAGSICYMISVFQQLFHIDSVYSEMVFNDYNDGTLLAIQQLFLRMKFSNRSNVSLMPFCDQWIGWDKHKVNIHEQQDALEFLQLILSQIPDNIGKLFNGSFSHSIFTMNGRFLSLSKEDFISICVDVKGFSNLDESLNSIIMPALFIGDNMYYSQEIQSSVEAKRITLIEKSSHVLVIQLKRFEYDLETMQRKKVGCNFEFPLEIDISPYCSKNFEGSTQYSLNGVVLHCGDSQGGHYYSIVRKKNGWIRLNDSDVTTIEESIMKSESFGSNSNDNADINTRRCAYLLFYVRNDRDLIPSNYHNIMNPFMSRIDEENSLMIKHELIMSEYCCKLIIKYGTPLMMLHFFIGVLSHSCNETLLEEFQNQLINLIRSNCHEDIVIAFEDRFNDIFEILVKAPKSYRLSMFSIIKCIIHHSEPSTGSSYITRVFYKVFNSCNIISEITILDHIMDLLHSIKDLLSIFHNETISVKFVSFVNNSFCKINSKYFFESYDAKSILWILYKFWQNNNRIIDDLNLKSIGLLILKNSKNNEYYQKVLNKVNCKSSLLKKDFSPSLSVVEIYPEITKKPPPLGFLSFEKDDILESIYQKYQGLSRFGGFKPSSEEQNIAIFELRNDAKQYFDSLISLFNQNRNKVGIKQCQAALWIVLRSGYQNIEFGKEIIDQRTKTKEDVEFFINLLHVVLVTHKIDIELFSKNEFLKYQEYFFDCFLFLLKNFRTQDLLQSMQKEEFMKNIGKFFEKPECMNIHIDILLTLNAINGENESFYHGQSFNYFNSISKFTNDHIIYLPEIISKYLPIMSKDKLSVVYKAIEFCMGSKIIKNPSKFDSISTILKGLCTHHIIPFTLNNSRIKSFLSYTKDFPFEHLDNIISYMRVLYISNKELRATFREELRFKKSKESLLLLAHFNIIDELPINELIESVKNVFKVLKNEKNNTELLFSFFNENTNESYLKKNFHPFICSLFPHSPCDSKSENTFWERMWSMFSKNEDIISMIDGIISNIDNGLHIHVAQLANISLFKKEYHSYISEKAFPYREMIENQSKLSPILEKHMRTIFDSENH